MKEFENCSFNQFIQWDWDNEIVPNYLLHGNLFCFGSNPQKNRQIAKQYAKDAIEKNYPCIIATKDGNKWKDIFNMAEREGYFAEYITAVDAIADTEEMVRIIADQNFNQSKRIFDAILENPKKLVLMEYPSDDEWGKTTQFDLLTFALHEQHKLHEESVYVKIIIDDSDGQIFLFPPAQMFSPNIDYCITMDQDITNQDWREDMQVLLCERCLSHICEDVNNVVCDEEIVFSYKRFFDLFTGIINTGVTPNVTNQMQVFIQQCLAMDSSEKHNITRPFLVVRGPEYAKKLFENVIDFYEWALYGDADQ